MSELNRLYNVRYRGGSLPDDDDGRDSVEIMVNHLALLAAPHWRIKDWIRRMAPWWGESKLEKLIDKVIAQPRRWTADTLGRRLNLTSDERDRLKIRTIGAVDLDKAGRERWRRERDRQAKEANRRAAGAKPQVQSAARTKPWIAAGVSRAKWYADRRAARQGQTMSNSGQFGPQYKSVVLSKTK